jgi:ArsR family transcriptional regulator
MNFYASGLGQVTRKLPNLLNLLRAAAEPTRLRLLAVLAHGELTVGEITQILKQSQPRISRHLKLLCDAGLLERFKEDQSVYYRLAVAADDAALRLHELVDAADPALRSDRERRDAVTAERARRATDRLAEQTAGDLHEPFGATVGDLLVDELAKEPIGDVLDVGTGAGFLLKTLAPIAGRAVGLDVSSDALRLARTTVHGAGLIQCVFRRGDMYRLPCHDDEFDTVTMGRVLSHAADPAAALAEAFRVLRPGGRLVLVDDFDTLEEKAGNPIAGLRRWLQAAGFDCDRLRPVDTGSSHLLLTIARRPVRLQEVA